MLLQVLKACLGIFVLLAVWIAVQAYIRRRMRYAAGFDVLEDMTHGCGCCGHSDHCGASQGACGEKLTAIGREI